MAVLFTNPDWAALLEELKLTSAATFLRLSGVIVSGHPDRHVQRLTLEGSGPPVPVFLKREHRIPWRDRLGNGLHGFGLVSKSLREWHTLRQVSAAGIPAPEPIAAGDANGSAFLLVQEVQNAVDLRQYLHGATAPERNRLSRRLGEEIARIHAAGFCHGDLYSKHVLVRLPLPAAQCAFFFLDWQRAFRAKTLAWTSRRGDLVALLATLADECFSSDCRRALLEAYCDAGSRSGCHLPRFGQVMDQVHDKTRLLLRKRKIRELRQPALHAGEQNLIWLDGERLCVTRQFLGQVQARLPAQFSLNSRESSTCHTSVPVALPGGQKCSLTRRHERWFFRRCWVAMNRRKPTSPEFHQAATIFRLERFRVQVPRLLAVGQRFDSFGRMSSFLLTLPSACGVRLADWLQAERSPARRRHVIRRAAEVLRSIHSAECVLGPHAALVLESEQDAEIGVDTVAGMRPARRVRHADRCRDLCRLHGEFASYCRRSEQLRFLLHYCAVDRLNAVARELIDAVLSSRRPRRIRSLSRSQKR